MPLPMRQCVRNCHARKTVTRHKRNEETIIAIHLVLVQAAAKGTVL